MLVRLMRRYFPEIKARQKTAGDVVGANEEKPLSRALAKAVVWFENVELMDTLRDVGGLSSGLHFPDEGGDVAGYNTAMQSSSFTASPLGHASRVAYRVFVEWAARSGRVLSVHSCRDP